MLLRPRRPPPPAPPSPASPDLEESPREASLERSASPEPPSAPASPGVSPVSPGSAQRTPWSARETELLLGELLQPAVWRALLLDRRRALPTYRRVSAALARQQVRRTPAQCRRRYKFLRDKLRDAHDQPPGPFDQQVHELMALLGDNGQPRSRRRSPGRLQRGRRSSSGAPLEPGAAREADSDPSRTLSLSPSPLKVPDAPGPPGSPPALSSFDSASGRAVDRAPYRGPDGSPPPPSPAPAREDPGDPEHHAPPQYAPLTLNAALVQTLGHLGDIVTILGPLRDQLLTLNQHVEQLRGSFDQTVSLAVGFILGSAAAERGVLAEPRQ